MTLPNPPSHLLSQLDLVMQSDWMRLRSLAQRIEWAQRAGEPGARLVEQFESQFAESAARCARRSEQRPAVVYDPELPITSRRDEIMAAIARLMRRG